MPEVVKRHLWPTMVTYQAYCLDKELGKAIEYLKEQVEQQEKDKRIDCPLVHL